MQITMSSFSYIFTNNSITGATIVFTANDSNGQYINAQVKVDTTDLASGQTFLSMSPSDIQTIAYNKFKGWVDNKEISVPTNVSASNNTVTAN